MSDRKQASTILRRLKSDVVLLTQKLQALIDQQATFILGHGQTEDSSLHKTRGDLRRTMLELASVNKALADSYKIEYSRREQSLKSIWAIKLREAKLRENIARIRDESKEASKLKIIEKKETELVVSVILLLCQLNANCCLLDGNRRFGNKTE